MEGPPPLLFLAFRFCVEDFLGLPTNPSVSTMCRSIDHSLLLNEKQAISPISKKIVHFGYTKYLKSILPYKFTIYQKI